jgi:hypothetical protein
MTLHKFKHQLNTKGFVTVPKSPVVSGFLLYRSLFSQSTEADFAQKLVDEINGELPMTLVLNTDDIDKVAKLILV